MKSLTKRIAATVIMAASAFAMSNAAHANVTFINNADGSTGIINQTGNMATYTDSNGNSAMATQMGNTTTITGTGGSMFGHNETIMQTGNMTTINNW